MADQSQPVAEVGSVRFEGDFQPVEREALAAQFSACRFRLLERSALGSGVVLVEWEGRGAAPQRGGARPLFAAPRQALYVLDISGSSPISAPPGGLPSQMGGATSARPAAGDRQGPARLERVDSQEDLAARYPGHFPTARVRADWRDRLRRLVRDVWPALMLAAATIWVLALVWTCRP